MTLVSISMCHGVCNSHLLSLETLKKQAAQQAAEYDRLATEFNKSNGLVSDKKAD